MRVLFLSHLYPPMQLRGYELACKNVAEGLAARGHDVRVLTSWCHLPRPVDEPDWVDRGLDLHSHIHRRAPIRLSTSGICTVRSARR